MPSNGKVPYRTDENTMRNFNLLAEIKRLYHEEALSDQDMAKRLNITLPHLRNLYSRYGLATRSVYSGESKPRFTKEVDATITRMFNDGYSEIAIGAKLKLKGAVVMARYNYLLRLQEKCSANRYEEIPCMLCRKPFISWDRRKNRHCVQCMETISGRSYSMAA